jgi:hypothetical protein
MPIGTDSTDAAGSRRPPGRRVHRGDVLITDARDYDEADSRRPHVGEFIEADERDRLGGGQLLPLAVLATASSSRYSVAAVRIGAWESRERLDPASPAVLPKGDVVTTLAVTRVRLGGRRGRPRTLLKELASDLCPAGFVTPGP